MEFLALPRMRPPPLGAEARSLEVAVQDKVAVPPRVTTLRQGFFLLSRNAATIIM
jgi:hypothetical protein